MKGKIYTVEECSRCLPLVERIAADLKTAYKDVERNLRLLEMLPQLKQADSETKKSVDDSLRRLQALIGEIEDLGGTVRDYEQASVDFYGELGGELVYFCWTPGETKILHYHNLDQGFSKRRAINAA